MNKSSLIKFGRLFGWRLCFLGLSTLTSIVWARFASKETYGAYQLVISVMTLVSSFCLNGISESITIAAARKYDGNTRRILAWRFGVGLVGALALSGAGLFYAKGQPWLWNAFVIAALFFPLTQLRPVWSGWLNGRGMVESLFKVDAILLVIWLAAFGAMVLAGATGLAAILAVKLLIEAVAAVLVVGFILKSARNELRDDKSFGYGLHVSVAQCFGGLIVMDKILLGSLSVADVAVYSVALLFPEQLKLLYAVINQMLVPEMYKAASVRDGWAYLRPRMPGICLMFTGMGLAGFFLFPTVIPLLFSQRYVQAVPYARWLWLSLAISAPATYLSNLLVAQQKKKYAYFIFVFVPILTFFCFLGWMKQGVWGMVTARIMSTSMVSFLYVLAFVVFLKRENRAFCAHC